jgi:hypothetical protein
MKLMGEALLWMNMLSRPARLVEQGLPARDATHDMFGFVFLVVKERDAAWRTCDGGQNSWMIGAAGRLCFSRIVY